MCGIVGFTGASNPELLQSMAKAIEHRGPDDDGFYSDRHVSLGMRRLAIVDLQTGKQPIHNEDNTVWVVYNGEIYNHRELRAELVAKGHRFYTDHCDSEVLVHLYEDEGPEFVNRLNGMFAIAIWDLKLKRLLLYRDRLGKKPLYYAFKSGKLYFASEIKALRCEKNIGRQPDLEALSQYFGLKNISAPLTAYKGIRQLLPGHYLTYEAGKADITEHPYWTLSFDRPLDITEEEAAEEIYRILDDSVFRRMQCDVEFGAYLSGGVDSSSIVALMTKHHSRPIKTFCLGYDDDFENKTGDMESAQKMAKAFGTDHHEYRMKAAEITEMLPRVLQAFDEPFSGTISTYFLSILMKKHIKVALSGDGADELFGSYLPHRLAFPIENYLALSASKQRDFALLSGPEKETLRPFNDPDQFDFLSQVANPNVAAWRNRLNVFTNDEKRLLLTGPFGSMTFSDPYECLRSSLTAADALNLSLEIDQKELLPNQILPFVDRLSMAHSIEVRVPFLDYRLVEFAASLPGDFKIRAGINKYILKRAVSGLIPEEVVQRPKEGFVLPVYQWMRTLLKPYILDTLSKDRISRSGLFSTSYVENLVKDFYNGKRHEAKVWNLVCFQIWWEGFVR